MSRILGSTNSKSIEERFREKYMIDDSGCWITDSVGFYVNRALGHVQSSQFAWFLEFGYYPSEKLYSTCKNKKCINPSHKVLAEAESIFWSNVQKSDGCWIWSGNKDGKGYGRVNFADFKSFSKAHRLAWFLTNGEIPVGMLVCHKCDNPSCVNPNHLFLGTIKDNNLDKVAKGRQKGARGERNFGAILNEKQVEAIRFLYASGEFSTYALSDIFQVSRNCISRVVNKITWSKNDYPFAVQ